MDYSRYFMIALVPFVAAAIIPWVAPDAVGRVLLVTLGWTAVFIIFMAGIIVGDVLASGLPKARLSVLSALGCCCLVFLAVGLYSVVSPLLGLVLMAIAFFFVVQLVQITKLWQRLDDQKSIFYRKVMWAVLGCLLMLFLSYYRKQVAG